MKGSQPQDRDLGSIPLQIWALPVQFHNLQRSSLSNMVFFSSALNLCLLFQPRNVMLISLKKYLSSPFQWLHHVYICTRVHGLEKYMACVSKLLCEWVAHHRFYSKDCEFEPQHQWEKPWHVLTRQNYTSCFNTWGTFKSLWLPYTNCSNWSLHQPSQQVHSNQAPNSCTNCVAKSAY